ncbi:hypothetical protein E2P81_ATG00721 [Venturia nashicola]|nr:hypothetical protein E2P81_ATG00721 [Venturia nashicola]
MAPSSRSNSGRVPSHRSSSSTLRDTTSGNSLRRAAMNNAAFNYGNPDEAAIMSASSVRYTASTPSFRYTASTPSSRSSSRSSRSSSHSGVSSRSAPESPSQSGSQFQASDRYRSEPTYNTSYTTSSPHTIRDSNVIRHRATTTVGSSGTIYRVAVVEPANSSSSTRSSRLSGDTMIASTRGPDSTRSYGSSSDSARRGGGNDRLLMPLSGRRDGFFSRGGGFGGWF